MITKFSWSINESWFSITKNAIMQLAKKILILLKLTALEASATDAAIQKKFFGSGITRP